MLVGEIPKRQKKTRIKAYDEDVKRSSTKLGENFESTIESR